MAPTQLDKFKKLEKKNFDEMTSYQKQNYRELLQVWMGDQESKLRRARRIEDRQAQKDHKNFLSLI